MERNEDRSGRMQLKCIDKTQPVEHTAQITLPDYRSEISRLLWVRPTFMPPTRFVGGGKADFSGPIRYNILYVGADGALYGAESEDSYAFSLPVDVPSEYDAASGLEMSIELVPDAVVSRVTGPRKLSVRSRLHMRACAYAERDGAPQISPDGVELQRLSAAVDCGRLISGASESFEVSDSAQVESAPGDLRLITANGGLLLSEVNAATDRVFYRGEVILQLLLCRENAGEERAAPFVLTRRVPFEREIPMDGITPDFAARATGAVGNIHADIEGERVDLCADVSLLLEGQSEDGVVLCRDAYAPGYRAECRFGEEKLWRAGACGNRNFSVSEECALSDLGVSSDATVLSCTADAELTERRAEGGRTVLHGELHCHVLYGKDGEYGVAEMTLPIRTQLDEAADDALIDVTVPLCRVTPGRDGSTWRADAEVQLSLRACREERVARLMQATLTPGEKRARADMEFCYPAAGESLWEVGKRYEISPDELAAANGISADDPSDPSALQGSKYLMIP